MSRVESEPRCVGSGLESKSKDSSLHLWFSVLNMIYFDHYLVVASLEFLFSRNPVKEQQFETICTRLIHAKYHVVELKTKLVDLKKENIKLVEYFNFSTVTFKWWGFNIPHINWRHIFMFQNILFNIVLLINIE